MYLLTYCVCRTVVQERQFEAICQRILNAKKHCGNMKEYLLQMKRDKPKVVSPPVDVSACVQSSLQTNKLQNTGARIVVCRHVKFVFFFKFKLCKIQILFELHLDIL